MKISEVYYKSVTYISCKSKF